MSTWAARFLFVGASAVAIFNASAAPDSLPVAPSAIPATCLWWPAPNPALRHEYHNPNVAPVGAPSGLRPPAMPPDWFTPVPGWQTLNTPSTHIPFGLVAPCYPAIRIAPHVYWSLP